MDVSTLGCLAELILAGTGELDGIDLDARVRFMIHLRLVKIQHHFKFQSTYEAVHTS